MASAQTYWHDDNEDVWYCRAVGNLSDVVTAANGTLSVGETCIVWDTLVVYKWDGTAFIKGGA